MCTEGADIMDGSKPAFTLTRVPYHLADSDAAKHKASRILLLSLSLITGT